MLHRKRVHAFSLKVVVLFQHLQESIQTYTFKFRKRTNHARQKRVTAAISISKDARLAGMV